MLSKSHSLVGGDKGYKHSTRGVGRKGLHGTPGWDWGQAGFGRMNRH